MVVSLSEFADMIGKSTNWLSNYIRRGQLAVLGKRPNQTVDLTIPVNAEFLNKWQTRRKEATGEPAEPSPAAQVNNDLRVFSTEIDQTELSFTAGLTRESPEAALSKAKKYSEIKAKEVEVRIKLIDESKKKGELLPTEHVKSIIATHSRSVTTAFKDATELLLVKISQRKQLSVEESATIRGDFITVINHAVNTAVDKSKKELRNLIRDFSQSKEVGEHG